MLLLYYLYWSLFLHIIVHHSSVFTLSSCNFWSSKCIYVSTSISWHMRAGGRVTSNHASVSHLSDVNLDMYGQEKCNEVIVIYSPNITHSTIDKSPLYSVPLSQKSKKPRQA
ncbi:hypothetical protein K439DRAFT_115029 [Ramaria rubella]|nr:hypothetical protein K439DRAFT_115029 [Ramaria rubella]